jgi:hypothetical protein
MLIVGMAKNPIQNSPIPAAQATKRKRGRHPSLGGPKSQAEIQRAYRARLSAAGKVVRIVDAAALTNPVVSTHPGESAIDRINERAMLEKLRDDLNNALIRIQILGEDRTRWQNDCARAEAELRTERQHHTNTIKDKILLQKEITELKRKPRRTKASRVA